MPSNLLLFRGFNTNYEAVTNRPAYFSTTVKTASGYVKTDTDILGAFRTTRALRFYDLRFIRTILGDLFPQRKSNSKDVINCCKTLALAYGVCSLKRQLELLQERYGVSIDAERLASLKDFAELIDREPAISGVDPVEARGVRIAETNNDAHAALFLKYIFGNRVHGYIAPALYSPYHTEKTSHMHTAEIVIFNPQEDGVVLMRADELYQSTKQSPTHYLREFQNVHFSVPGFDKPHLKMKGGGSAKRLDSPNTVFEADSKSVACMEKKAQETIAKFLGDTALLPKDKYAKAPAIYDVCPWST